MAAHALHRHALAMAAGDQQQQVGERRPALHQARQPCGQCMCLQVVDRDVGQPVRQGDALRHLAANDQAADQPGAGTRRHAAQIGKSQPGPRHHAAHLLRQQRQMRAGCDLRHHAAIGRVRCLLAGDAFRQDVAITVQHCRGGLVARGLDAEHRAKHRPSKHRLPRHRLPKNWLHQYISHLLPGCMQ